MEQLDVDIVMCSTRPLRELGPAVDRLVELVPGPERIIVVLPRDHEGLVSLGRRSRVYVVESERANLSEQRNTGIALSQAAIVGFLDDDTVLAPGHLSDVCRAFGSRPELVGLGGRISNFATPQRWISFYRRLFQLSRAAPTGQVDQLRSGLFVWPDPRFAPAVTHALWGCCMWWRRESIAGMRFNSEFSALDDVEFGLRASKLGDLMLSAEASAQHLRSPVGRRPILHSIRQLKEARRIALSNSECGFSPPLWMWAVIGQVLLACSAWILRRPDWLAPEYRSCAPSRPC